MHSPMRSPLHTLKLVAAALFISVSVAVATLLAQSGMFSNNSYNSYGRGLYLNNYAELYGMTARSRGNAANFYPQANNNFSTFGSRANNVYQGGYIQNYNSAPYYDPYRNN